MKTIGALAGAMLAMTTLAGGCRTIGEDLADFAESLTPVTSSQAARWATDPNDPDRRRQGIVLIANSSIGGYEPYVRLYREYVNHESDPIVRAVSLRALAKHGEPEDAAAIAANLDPEIPQVRWEAAKGLQRLHGPEVVPAMLAAWAGPEAFDTPPEGLAPGSPGPLPTRRPFS